MSNLSHDTYISMIDTLISGKCEMIIWTSRLSHSSSVSLPRQVILHHPWQCLTCSSKACLAAHNPKYKCSIPLLFQFSSYPFNFTFISCLYTGSSFLFFPIIEQKPLSTSLSLFLPRCLSPSGLPGFIYPSFLLHLNSSLPPLPWVWEFIVPSALHIPLITVVSGTLDHQWQAEAPTMFASVCVFLQNHIYDEELNALILERGQHTHILSHTHTLSLSHTLQHTHTLSLTHTQALLSAPRWLSSKGSFFDTRLNWLLLSILSVCV